MELLIDNFTIINSEFKTSFNNFVKTSKNLNFNRQMLKQEIVNRGYTLKELSKSTKVSLKIINDYFLKNSKKINEKQNDKI